MFAEEPRSLDEDFISCCTSGDTRQTAVFAEKIFTERGTSFARVMYLCINFGLFERIGNIRGLGPREKGDTLALLTSLAEKYNAKYNQCDRFGEKFTLADLVYAQPKSDR